nr:uncharacterized protein LOC110126190 isoform X2 [Odocoileus virginianus texanus]
MTIRHQGQQYRPRMAFLRKLPRRLLVHVGLRGPDCPEGVSTCHACSEKLPVTPVTHGGNLHRNAPDIALISFPGSGTQPLRPLPRIRLPNRHYKDRFDYCPHLTGKEAEESEDQHWENCQCDTTVSLQR